MLPNICELAAGFQINQHFDENYDGNVERIISENVPVFFQEMAKGWIEKQLDRENQKRHLRACFKAMSPTFTKQLSDTFEEHIRRGVGVLSLSAKNDDLLMWAHYADEHRGFLLELDDTHPALNSRRSETDEFFHPRQVSYSETRPKLTLMDMDGPKLFLMKSNDWQYEQEWRVIKPISNGVQSQTNDEVYLFDLPAKAIQSVILGDGMSFENRAEIQKILLSNERYNHIELKETQLQSDTYALKVKTLNFRPLSYSANKKISLFIHGIEDKERHDRLHARIGGAIGKIGQRGIDIRCLEQFVSVEDIEPFAEQIWGEEVLPYRKDSIVLGKVNDGELQIDLYLFTRDIQWLISEKEDEFGQAVENLHKALLRVHDLTCRWRMFGNDGMYQTPVGRLQYLEPMLTGVWTEYYVSRNALNESDSNVDLQDLKARFDISNKYLLLKIMQYRTHGDLGELLKEVLPTIELLMQALASVLGQFHKRNIDLDEIIDEFLERDKKVIREMSRSLNYLYRYYPNWEDTEEFRILIGAIEDYASGLGIFFDDSEDLGDGQIWVSIL